MMTPDQVDVFARGLYHVAQVDGIDDSELKLIHEFLEETGQTGMGEHLERSGFRVNELAILETNFLKRVFLKACLVLIRSDGKITDEEKGIVAQVANYLDLEDDFAELDAEAEKESF
jgi:hypothetical protein